MRTAALGAVLCLAAAGCGSARQSLPVLQRYQRLKPILAAATAGTARVAADSASLARAFSSLQVGPVRREAMVLKQDAMRLENDAGRAAAGIRPLLPGAPDGHVRKYFRLVLAGLSADWTEARALAGVARILPGDPWLVAPDDERRFNQLERMARGEARTATRDAALAAVLRRRYPRSFQYIPVKSSPRSRAVTSTHGSDG